MRVTLKTVNAELARIAPSVELVKGSGYFFFRGGEADDWIDRSVRVEAIGSLTTEEWVGEYKRLKTLNQDIAKSAKQAPPKAAPEAKPAKPVNKPAPRHEPPPPPPPAPKEPCSAKAKLIAELEQAHKDLIAIEEQQARAAREDRFPELVTLSVAASKERSKFDRALVAIREHSVVHGC